MDFFYWGLESLQINKRSYVSNKIALSYALGLSYGFLDDSGLVKANVYETYYKYSEYPLFLFSLLLIVISLKKPLILYCFISFLDEKSRQDICISRYDLSCRVFAFGYFFSAYILFMKCLAELLKQG